MRHIMNALDLSVDEIDDLIALAQKIMKHPEEYAEICKGKKLATCFYEPSTRTRLSFEAAMLNLGGSVLGFSKAKAYPIRSVSSLRMRTSVRCVIPKKVRRL